ncbi:MAG: MFS transporter [Flavobacteriales bacterium]
MKKNAHILIVIVASLGYFVDIYDLVLFNVVKIGSLHDIMKGASDAAINDTGKFLFNMQMTGMLIGGILWGVWGDKKGRLSVLFGSILLYSVANIMNAFVTTVPAYAIVRVIAGIGLAGELGAGITMVTESMSRKNRGWGTMIIVAFGALGAVLAATFNEHGESVTSFINSSTGMQLVNWQSAYILGGVMGLALLALRIGTFESGMYKEVKEKKIKRGYIGLLFRKKNFARYLQCILIGIPIWYVIGLLLSNSQQDFAPALHVEGVVNGEALMYAYLGLSAGDLVSGLLSQVMKSRRKVVLIYLLMTAVLVTYFLFFANGISKNQYYTLSFLLGCSTGYWAIFVTIAAEQFGTNIRSTVANTVPNFVRGTVPVIVALWGMLCSLFSINVINSAMYVGVLVLLLAFWALYKMNETFNKDLNYTEE